MREASLAIPRLLWPLIVIAPAAALILTGWAPDNMESAPYRNPRLPVEKRVDDLLPRMTLDEKLDMLAGAGWMESRGNTRLGIPSIRMADGPMGVRAWYGPSSETSAPNARRVVNSTAFPAGIAMAATWNPELVGEEGRTIAEEARALGRDQMLGPTVNIALTPLWGRNFEGYGEDPYLAARMGVAYIKGMQGAGVIATVKHFAANNQEYQRLSIDAKISERALHEIYFPAFKAAVQEAAVWSVMSAYNKVNGHWCAENPYLLRDVLEKEWGFRGYVISDWGSTHSTADTVNAGLDLEMPGGDVARHWLEHAHAEGSDGDYLTAGKLRPLVESGQVKQAVIDDAVRRLLRTMFTAGLFERHEHEPGDVDTPAQRELARRTAVQGIVLLKNDGGILPLAADKVHSIAAIGPNASVARTGGGGSSQVRPRTSVSPIDGLRERAGAQVQVGYALGVAMPGEDPLKETAEARAALLKEAVELASKSDVAIVFAGDGPHVEREGEDRASMDLPAGQDELIRAVATANRNTVVVLNVGSPVTMTRWIAATPAVVNAWFPGEEAGHAIADVLFGDANPSGKLPVTFPKRLEDSPAYGHYPGTNGVVEYAEGIYVGYRHFDTHDVEPQFPFGHGLSYTTFGYSNLKATSPGGGRVEVSLDLRNTGRRAGAEVAQLYVHEAKPKLDRPVKELKAFRRVELKPGELQTVSFTLDKAAFSYYDPAKRAWVADPGRFEILVGSSSRDIRLRAGLELAE